jgi:hypothetical protein
VVIVDFDTPLAKLTVPGSLRFDYDAVGANMFGRVRLVEIEELLIVVRNRIVAWVEYGNDYK